MPVRIARRGARSGACEVAQGSPMTAKQQAKLDYPRYFGEVDKKLIAAIVRELARRKP